ncbi:MAG: type II toxin-antitoxin system VapC family toxin [Alphaproteobacteria bacterium]|nr:type II toxin-antitoxin system VapC family toxin [Alphaproteobacteria bacterium]
MNLLLDTHALLWATANMPELSHRARQAIAFPENRVIASVVSAWEIAIKVSLGKLAAPANLAAAIASCGFEPRTIAFEDAEMIRSLPHHHGDPFDRLLVAQALREGLTIVTRDPVFRRYEVPTLW